MDSSQFSNPPDDEIRALLRRVKTIAVVGLSSSPSRPSHGVGASLKSFGYHVIPVNPNEREVHGEHAWPNLASVPVPVDLVNVFRRPEHVRDIVEDCLRLQLPALWLQLGVVDEPAALAAQQAGMTVVMDRCIYQEYLRLAK
jgi:predicted CoA-binding protein